MTHESFKLRPCPGIGDIWKKGHPECMVRKFSILTQILFFRQAFKRVCRYRIFPVASKPQALKNGVNSFACIFTLVQATPRFGTNLRRQLYILLTVPALLNKHDILYLEVIWKGWGTVGWKTRFLTGGALWGRPLTAPPATFCSIKGNQREVMYYIDRICRFFPCPLRYFVLL
jgi:hypothetical protein